MLSSNLSPKIVAGHWCSCSNSHFHYACRFNAHILAHVYGLLGPCFKTGRITPCGPTCQGDLTQRNAFKAGHEQAHKPTFSDASHEREISPSIAVIIGSSLGTGTRRHRTPRNVTSTSLMSALPRGYMLRHRTIERSHTPLPMRNYADTQATTIPRRRAGCMRVIYSDFRHV